MQWKVVDYPLFLQIRFLFTNLLKIRSHGHDLVLIVGIGDLGIQFQIITNNKFPGQFQCIMATTSTNTLQSDGAFSSLNTNKRGPTRGEIVKKVRKQIGGGRLTVEFCPQFRQAIGLNSQKFNNECGIICRKECPFNYMDWRTVPKSVKASLRERILINFDVDLSSEIVVDVIDFQMGRSFKNHRAKLQKHFLKCNGKEDVERAKGLKPNDSNIDDDSWHILCDWSSEKFHVMSTKNSENRGKRKHAALNVMVSTPNHHFRNNGLLSGR